MAVYVPLDRIDDNPWQTRESYDPARVEALAADIKQNGLLQPPVGRMVNQAGVPVVVESFYLDKSTIQIYLDENPDHRLQLAFGHTRLRAYRHGSGGAEQLGPAMPVEIRTLSDEQMATMAWSENAQRKDLNPVEEARAIRRRMEDFGWNQNQVADHLKLDRSTIANKLRLLKLPNEILGHLADGSFSERTAVMLLPIYQLSDEERAAAERGYDWYGKPSYILENVLKGAWSSEHVREHAKKVAKSARDQLKREADAKAEAEESRRRIAEAKKDLAGGEKLKTVQEIGYNRFARVSDDPKNWNYVEGCSPACACRSQAIDGKELVPICLNQERHAELNQAHRKAKAELAEREMQERLAAFREKVVAPDGSTSWSPQSVLLLVKAVIGYPRREDLKAAAESVGAPEEVIHLDSGATAKQKKAAEAALLGLSMDHALRFALEVIVRKDLREVRDYDNKKTSAPFEAVMRGVPYPKPVPEASGDGAQETIEPITVDDQLQPFRLRLKRVTDWMSVTPTFKAATAYLQGTADDLDRLTADLAAAPGIPGKRKKLFQSEIDSKLEWLRKDLERRELESQAELTL